MKKLVSVVAVAAFAICLAACAFLKSEVPALGEDLGKCAIREFLLGSELKDAAKHCGREVVHDVVDDAFTAIFAQTKASYAVGEKAGAAKVGAAACGDAGAPPAKPAADAGASIDPPAGVPDRLAQAGYCIDNCVVRHGSGRGSCDVFPCATSNPALAWSY